MVWVLLTASAVAVLLVGVLATLLVVGKVGAWPSVPARFLWRFAGACALTIASLSLRSLRWVFLLRRAETRIPIRDAYIGYLVGFSLLFAPFLLGETSVRALLNRRRGGVPFHTTAVVNVWERALDMVALGLIAAVLALAMGQRSGWAYATLVGVALMLIDPVRRLMLGLVIGTLALGARLLEPNGLQPRHFDRLASHSAWLTALTTSVVAWMLPGLGLWLIAGALSETVSLPHAELSYAQSVATGGVMLAPGGVLVAGRQMIESLTGQGTPGQLATLIALAVRLATAGVSIALGVLCVLMHLLAAATSSVTHFDDIADAYDVQIPESRRHALLDLKTTIMHQVIAARGAGRRGLDVGCGQGAYVARMRQLGFDVSGIDVSPGQILLAARNVGAPGAVRVGSVLEIPAADVSFDFLYVINVLHHLSSVEEQKRAFAELFRVLVPGGLLFVHEINTRNILFRFYMGYVFPSLNCIDEGVERWLLPHRMQPYTATPVAEVRYFTFLPDFIPQAVARVLSPIERLLEQSPMRVYSAHYMAVLVKGPETAVVTGAGQT